MLKEIDEVKNIGSPYRLSDAEINKRAEKIAERFASIRVEIEAMWEGPPIFMGKEIGIVDLEAVGAGTSTVTFIDCTSKEWSDIAKKLAAISSLTTLELSNCDAGDQFCSALATSKSINHLKIDNCTVSDVGARQLSQIKSLEELIFDSTDEVPKTTNKNTFT